jgi:uncharacterized protein YjiS (DUF1127 family)
MTALDTATHAPHAPIGMAAAVSRVAGALGKFLRGLWRRREVNRLGELSDHQLADIGLTRSDLVVALHAPLHTDPTTRLSTLASERYWVERGARLVR